MRQSLSISAVLLAAGLVFPVASSVSAQTTKKLTYEEAYEACRTGFMKGTGSAAGTHAGGNYARGAACMKQYGYRLKKSKK